MTQVRAHRVTTTPALIKPRNPIRKVVTFFNDTTVDVYLGVSNQVSSSGAYEGILVRAGGGSYEDEDWKGEWWAITASGTSTIKEFEVTETENGKADDGGEK